LEVPYETTNLHPFAHLSSTGIERLRDDRCKFVSNTQPTDKDQHTNNHGTDSFADRGSAIGKRQYAHHARNSRERGPPADNG
jgi:hypothetical protein